jgi:hypothetical protein
MSAPSPPKPKKMNPYAGVSSNADIYRAQQALGIDKVKKDKDKRRIDEWLLNERWEKESTRSTFNNAYRTQMREGNIGRKDRTQWALDQALGAEQTLIYDRQADEQSDQLQAQYDQSRADQKEAAEAQQKLMEEMMDQPVYMPKQQGMPMVQKPEVRNDPLLPAPAPNTPMSIAAPPPPEMTRAQTNMAIVRTPRSTQARSRRATRGTSRLTNY